VVCPVLLPRPMDNLYLELRPTEEKVLMSITPSKIQKACADAVVTASISYTSDHKDAYKDAVEAETQENARGVLKMILDNGIAAEEGKLPLCDDTGIPYVLLEIGDSADLSGNVGGILDAVNAGVAEGLRALPGRPMAVKGDEYERITQSRGLYEDPGMVVPSPIRIKAIKGSQVRVTVLMLGGGPEIRARTFRVFHHHDLEVFSREIASWAVEMARKLGCTPCVPTVGIGRTHYEATCLMMDAMTGMTFGEESDFEKLLTRAVNDSFTGPLGIGGKITALQSFIKVGPQRASGVRIVCLRVGCIVDPRRCITILE